MHPDRTAGSFTQQYSSILSSMWSQSDLKPDRTPRISLWVWLPPDVKLLLGYLGLVFEVCPLGSIPHWNRKQQPHSPADLTQWFGPESRQNYNDKKPHPALLKGLLAWGDSLVRCILPSMIRISQTCVPPYGDRAGRQRAADTARSGSPRAAGPPARPPGQQPAPTAPREEAVPGTPHPTADGPGSPAPRGVRGTGLRPANHGEHRPARPLPPWPPGLRRLRPLLPVSPRPGGTYRPGTCPWAGPAWRASGPAPTSWAQGGPTRPGRVTPTAAYKARGAAGARPCPSRHGRGRSPAAAGGRRERACPRLAFPVRSGAGKSPRAGPGATASRPHSSLTPAPSRARHARAPAGTETCAHAPCAPSSAPRRQRGRASALAHWPRPAPLGQWRTARRGSWLGSWAGPLGHADWPGRPAWPVWRHGLRVSGGAWRGWVPGAPREGSALAWGQFLVGVTCSTPATAWWDCNTPLIREPPLKLGLLPCVADNSTYKAPKSIKTKILNFTHYNPCILWLSLCQPSYCHLVPKTHHKAQF